MEGSGAAEEKAAAVLTGLKPHTTYYYRLVAENENGVNCGVGYELRTEPLASSPSSSAEVSCRLPAPSIDDESVVDLGSSAAALQAQIDPQGHDTTYQFQYGTESCRANPSACASVPATAQDIGSGETDVAVSAALEALKPNTTYFYRAIATSPLGTSDGIERTFTTPGPPQAFALADGRSWEIVTPPDKHGAAVEALTSEGGLILAAENGDALTYVADGAISEEALGNRSPEMQQVLARRTVTGWTSADIATPNSGAQGVSAGSPPEYQFFSPDLSLALVEPWATSTAAVPPLAPEATQTTMYVRNDETGTFQPLVTEANVAPGTDFGAKMHFVCATPDLATSSLRSTVALTGPGSAPGLYEWSEGAPQLQFLSMLPSRASRRHEAALGYYHVAANAISADGTRVIWTNEDENSGSGHLYMRDILHGTDAPAGRRARRRRATDSSRKTVQRSSRPPPATARRCSSPTSSA